MGCSTPMEYRRREPDVLLSPDDSPINVGSSVSTSPDTSNASDNLQQIDASARTGLSNGTEGIVLDLEASPEPLVEQLARQIITVDSFLNAQEASINGVVGGEIKHDQKEEVDFTLWDTNSFEENLILGSGDCENYGLGWLFDQVEEKTPTPEEIVEEYDCWMECIRYLFVEVCDTYDEAHIDQDKLREILIKKKANTLYPIFAMDGLCSSPKRKRSPQDEISNKYRRMTVSGSPSQQGSSVIKMNRVGSRKYYMRKGRTLSESTIDPRQRLITQFLKEGESTDDGLGQDEMEM